MSKQDPAPKTPQEWARRYHFARAECKLKLPFDPDECRERLQPLLKSETSRLKVMIDLFAGDLLHIEVVDGLLGEAGSPAPADWRHTQTPVAAGALAPGSADQTRADCDFLLARIAARLQAARRRDREQADQKRAVYEARQTLRKWEEDFTQQALRHNETPVAVAISEIAGAVALLRGAPRLMPGESLDELTEFAGELWRELGPEGPVEQIWARTAIDYAWQMMSERRHYAELQNDFTWQALDEHLADELPDAAARRALLRAARRGEDAALGRVTAILTAAGLSFVALRALAGTRHQAHLDETERRIAFCANQRDHYFQLLRKARSDRRARARIPVPYA